MMKIITLPVILCVVSLVVNDAYPKEWNGIKPLYSTRADVERVFGIKSSGNGMDKLKINTFHVEIRYTTQPCRNEGEGTGEWNVPIGTVVSIVVIPQTTVLFSELKLDKDIFKISSTDVVAAKIYTDRSSGFQLEVNENTDEISYFRYFESESDEKLRCQRKVK